MIKERSYDDWLVFTCLNCKMDAYCQHAVKGLERVLLPMHLNVSTVFFIRKATSPF